MGGFMCFILAISEKKKTGLKGLKLRLYKTNKGEFSCNNTFSVSSM